VGSLPIRPDGALEGKLGKRHVRPEAVQLAGLVEEHIDRAVDATASA
jgi:hypothetical protein